MATTTGSTDTTSTTNLNDSSGTNTNDSSGANNDTSASNGTGGTTATDTTGMGGSTTTATASTASSTSGDTTPGAGANSLAPGDHVFVTEFQASNNSGAHGVAAFVLQGNTLTSEVVAQGLEPNQLHEMHIHGIPGGQSQLPTLAQDANHDGLIQDMEAQSVVGPAVLSLTSSGTVTSAESGTDFPTAAADGTINFHQTYTFDTNNPDQANILNELQSLGKDSVEIHGETVPQSPGSATLTYDPSIPVAGGLLHDVTGTAVGDVAGASVLGSDSGSLLALNQVDPFGLGHA